jgi:hypothetical protein
MPPDVRALVGSAARSGRTIASGVSLSPRYAGGMSARVATCHLCGVPASYVLLCNDGHDQLR